MKKIILDLFIILFCFSIGIAGVQEKELSKEEKVKAELDIKIESYLKLLNRSRLEKLSKEQLIIEILDLKEFIKLDQLTIKLLEELVEMHEEEEKEKKFAWLDKDSWRERIYGKSYLEGEEEDSLKRIEEENERLEDLLEEFKSEKFRLDLDMMSHRWSMLMLKPDPFDYYMATQLGISLAMSEIELGIYPYYPSYSTKTDQINYEPLLFTLWALSPGKKDWTKYWRLKLLLKNK